MRKNNSINIIDVARRLAACGLLLFAFFGNTWAQSASGRFVIKRNIESVDHFLAHVRNGDTWELQDATTFSPNCLWISDNTFTQGGTNKNYYFYDHTNTARFLGAPEFHAGGILTLSNTVPAPSMLNNPQQQYYFYKWDGGLGRGKQYNGVPENWCEAQHHGWDDGECWEVYWVSYDAGSNSWKLSDEHYELTEVPSGGMFYAVSITEHPSDTTTVSGGLTPLAGFEMEYVASPLTTHQVSPTVADYQYTVIPEYTTYVFEGVTHNYYNDADQGSNTPDAVNSGTNAASSCTYKWTLTGDGAGYLAIDDNTSSAPTITYSTPNNDGHKEATLTLTVTYADGSKQTSTATILVKTPCQNPSGVSATANNMGVAVSWVPTADAYTVSWKKTGAASWNAASLGNVTSYTITGLEFETEYTYKVQATCDPNNPTEYTITTLADPGLVVAGGIFGGGRMADVSGNTEVVIINSGIIEAVYGGNDIAGSVGGENGSKIILGVDENDPDYDSEYGHTTAAINIGSVYGGGNGYYAYNGSSFVAASADYTEQSVDVGGQVNLMTQTHEVGEVVWTNTGTEAKTLTFPSIVKTAITVTNDFVKVDSVFGGAKNAFLTTNSGNGSSITVNGGTAFAVFGGNNFGGGQGYGKHYIEVNATTTNLSPNITNSSSAGYGRDFGIRYLFGGGNKVEGSTTDIYINGGQCDNVFAGGNAADIYKANVEVNCSLGDIPDNTSYTFGNTYSNAINTSNYTSGTIGENTIDENYGWDGVNGIYNVRTLYGGNNEAEMTRLPMITLTSGSVGTVYGGGNAGDMMGVASDDGAGGTLVINGDTIVYSTWVELNSDKIIVDYIYGGCRMSNVANSTWVRLKKGHVGTVYGGCNISGDVGSSRVYDPYPSGHTYPQNLEEQRVLGGTYVQAGDGGDNTDLIVYNNIYAGSNGYYHCNDGIYYESGVDFSDPDGLYVGLTIPTHNETSVIIGKGTTVMGNVYAGGNLASVGFDDDTGFPRGYPELVGLASVRMEDGIVKGDVYGGGNMASIFGINEVMISGGTINGSLYGGNDRTGTVAEKTNRILPAEYTIASDGKTSLTDRGIKTYVGVSGNANITTVFGGGNGDYIYGGSGIQFCGTSPSLPIQSSTFVDININGGANGGHIGSVYGGGDGISIWEDATVFINVKDPVYDRNHVDVVFGGNNKGDLLLVPEIILLHGQVGTVYGGCNQGAMTASGSTLQTIEGYDNIGSYVRLRETFVASADSTHVVDAIVTDAVYGGCRMNGVSQNSLVYVEGGNHSNVKIFGGSDISGTVENTSRVVVAGGTVGDVFGGGNGDYDYNTAPYQGLSLPYCNTSCVDMLGGTASNLFAGGNACSSGTTITQVDGGLVTTGIYGGCNTRGAVDGDATLNIYGGTIGASGLNNEGSIFGGGYGQETSVDGNVIVNFGDIMAEASLYPMLIGNLYGGSALGDVNTDNTNTTEINILNGSITGPVVDDPVLENNVYGNVFGGGLGRKAGTDPAVEALVKGKVYVRIGKTDSPPSSLLSGKATLINCSVYGCNNTNGSPQDDVYVDVYETAHVDGLNTIYDDKFAILRVFGGGNEANYAPENNNPDSEKKTHVYVHGCDNTVKFVYGGGNAADAVGVETIIEGGHFDEIYGGGNGAVVPANIGNGGIGINVMAGHISYLYEGSNKQGDYPKPINNPIPPQPPVGYCSTCGDVIVETFFFGDNEAEHFGDIERTIECEDAENYHYTTLFGGSRWAIVYGDIKLTVCGGFIERLFGGSKGYALDGRPAHVRRFPSEAEIEANPNKYSQSLRDYIAAHPELVGHGGNIELTILGGTIGEVIGGCDEYGNVEGKIMVIIDDAGDPECPLQVGDIYGASNMTVYEPWDDNQNQIYFNNNANTISTPKVVVIKGSTGLDYDFDGSDPNPVRHFDGNIYGGGNEGKIRSNAIVVVGDGTTGSSATPVTIGGSVYGGGNKGDVEGSPEVVIVPETHTLTFVNPTPAGSGTFTVTYPRGRGVSGVAEVHDGDGVGEGVVLRIVATPTAATGRSGVGYLFKRWVVTGEGAFVNRSTSASTLFTMGTAEASLKAEFEEVEAFQLTVAADPSGDGTFKVNGSNYSSPVWVAQTASVTVEATPVTGRAFHHWEVSGTGASISSTTQLTTTFTMGTANATLTAHFVPSHTLTMVADPNATGTFKVGGADYSDPVWVAETASVSVVATPATGYLFDHWEIVSGTGASVAEVNTSPTEFTMGTDNATLKAYFVPAHTLTMEPSPSGTGTFKVNNVPYSAPILIPDNASVPVVATPATGYVFDHWVVSGTGASVASTTSASTTLTMGAADVTLTAVFLPAHTLTLMSDPVSAGSFNVNGAYYSGPVWVADGASVTIEAFGTGFLEWEINSGNGTIANTSENPTTFTMGNENTTVTAKFNQ